MFQGVILDLDGTVYRGERPVAGAPEFIRRARREGVAVLFATNRANRAPETIARMLRGYGLECSAADVLTAATATAEYLRPVGTVFVVGEEPLRQALAGAGFAEDPADPDYVVVGLDRGLSYDKLNTAVRAILRRSRFVATNPDLLVSAADGSKDIGNGAVVAAIAAATGIEPLVVGKPHAPLFEAALARLGLAKEQVLVVGDNLATDVAGGLRAGLRTAAIYTGISRPEDVARLGIEPDFQAAGYREAEKIVFGGARGLTEDEALV